MTTTYRTSDGKDQPIKDMPFPYLCSALAKLERGDSGPGREAEIAAMSAEKAERERVFGLMVADLKGQGFSVAGDVSNGFYLVGPLGSQMTVPTRAKNGSLDRTCQSEDAVWWALLKRQELVL